MTAYEKWALTVRAMKLVRANYELLKGGGTYRGASARDRQQLEELCRWLRAVERAYRSLRSRRGKSPARARRDWLTARCIELMIFDGAGEERVKRSLNSPHPLHDRYVRSLREEAVAAVERAAQEEGLLGD